MDEEILDYNEQKEGWVSKVVDWQKKHISDRQMTLILAFIIGLLASVAGYFLHGIVHEIQLLLTSGFNKGTYNLLFLLFPIVGIYLTMLFIKYVVRDNISHGITRVLYAISTKNSKLKAHNCWSSVVASGITIGFGGSVGAEAPIVLTGSAIGSNLGQIFRMDKKTMILLVGCGASAAIAGIFKAPIAGLVFTLEVLMVDLSMASFAAYPYQLCNSYLLYLHPDGLQEPFRFYAYQSVGARPRACLLVIGHLLRFGEPLFHAHHVGMRGFLCQAFALSIRKAALWWTDSEFAHLPLPFALWRGIFGCQRVAEGTECGRLGAGDEPFALLRAQPAAHPLHRLGNLYQGFATSATNGSGGCGGTFAPSLIIGGFARFPLCAPLECESGRCLCS